MKKFYKVNLYKVEKYRKPKNIGSIIVENGVFYAKEIMTKQKFRIYPTITRIDGIEKDNWINKYKQYLFLVERDFCDKNIVSIEQLESYIDNFELEMCPFSRIIMAKEQELETKRRVQEIKRKLK